MRSDNVTKGAERAPNRSLFYALGYTPEELERPLIGVVSAYSEIVPGHMNLDKVADAVKAGIQMAGGTPILIPAIGVCDGIAMGHVGMKYSLASRELICDSVETMTMAHQLDGLVLVPNCDKIVPGMVMAAVRMDVPAVVCSGGPMLAGTYGGEEVSLSKMFEAVGAYKAGLINDEQLEDCTCNCCPSCGSCSGMYTANSMNCLCEAIGIALPGNGTIPAVYSKRLQLAKHSGMAIMEMVKKGITARQIINERSIRNALTCDMALGCSTNTVLHLLAIAYEAGVPVDLKLFNEISARTPNLCHLAPAGPTHMPDLYAAGGIQVRHVGGACRSQMAEVRGAGTDLIEELQVHRHACLIGNGQQVEDGVGGAAQSHIAGQCIADGALVDDLAGRDALFDHLHNGHAGVLGQLQALGVDGRDGAVAGQRNADGLAQTVHAVGSVHTRAGAAAGAAVAGAVFQLFVVDEACFIGTHRLEHLGEADLLAAVGTGQHGAAGADHRRHIHADGCHDHAGHDLITVGHQHKAVQLMGHGHGLHAVADELAGSQRIFHAHMAHGDTVAHADGRDQDGGAACHLDACLNGVGHLIQVHVAGHDLTVGAHHADEGALQLFRGVAQCIEQAAVGRALRALGHVVASHGFRSSLFSPKGKGAPDRRLCRRSRRS